MNQEKQAGFAHLALVVIVLVVAGVVAAGLVVVGKNKGIGPFKPGAPNAQQKTAKFVTALPLDLEQIESISKFRSCSGHDYSGKNVDGVVEQERSMKNYAVPIKALQGTQGKIKIFAPFDAVVINNSEGKKGDNLDLSPTAAPGWVYELGHVDSDKSLAEGTKVTAGQLIGYYNENGAFDLQFWFGGKNTVNTLNGYFDSIFSHMTDELAKKMEPYGLSADNLVVSKQARDDNPCKPSGTVDMGSTIFAGDIKEDQVIVKNKANPTGAASAGDNSSKSGECALPKDQRPPGCS